MEKSWILLFAILAILVVTFFLGFLQANITGNSIKSDFDYSYTKAICDGKNLCMDYEIKCKNNKSISVSPITGSVVQFPESWKDPRNKEDMERTC